MRRGENFPLLDGLRGIAAFAVMLFHARQILGGTAGDATSSYLAVDFFFMLSGFVVCAAYGRRLETSMTWGRFMTIRLIRLWPMLVIGALLGGVVWTIARTQESSLGAALGGGFLVAVGAALLLPVGLLHGRRLIRPITRSGRSSSRSA